MATNNKPIPIKSTEINFESEKEYVDFIEYVKNPPAPSEYVKKLIATYQSKRL